MIAYNVLLDISAIQVQLLQLANVRAPVIALSVHRHRLSLQITYQDRQLQEVYALQVTHAQTEQSHLFLAHLVHISLQLDRVLAYLAQLESIAMNQEATMPLYSLKTARQDISVIQDHNHPLLLIEPQVKCVQQDIIALLEHPQCFHVLVELMNLDRAHHNVNHALLVSSVQHNQFNPFNARLVLIAEVIQLLQVNALMANLVKQLVLKVHFNVHNVLLVSIAQMVSSQVHALQVTIAMSEQELFQIQINFALLDITVLLELYIQQYVLQEQQQCQLEIHFNQTANHARLASIAYSSVAFSLCVLRVTIV